MKILVTGGAGFIGARTAQMLLEQGHEVVVVDNMNDYYDVRLKSRRLLDLARTAGGTAVPVEPKSRVAEYLGPHEFRAGRLHFVETDIEVFNALDDLFAENKFDAVVNLAARAGVRYSMENPLVYMTTNAIGTLNLLDCMKKHGVGKMVLASTSSLYAGQPMPFSETLPVNTPISPYAASKKSAEVMAYTYHHLYGIDVSVVRYFTVFGPAGRPDMSPFRFMRWVDDGAPIQLYGDGEQSRDFTYVDDVARGTIAALKNVGYEIVNIGGGNNPISILTMIGWIEELLGKKAVINFLPENKSDMRITWADISKAERLFGWKPLVSPRRGFELTAQWYAANRDWVRTIAL
jgi:nucleoside-diphosphate-sugar epimerase